MADKTAQMQHKHWHYVYKKRRKHVLGASTKRIAIGQIIALVGAVIAGFHLDHNKTSLALIVGAFVIMPGVFDLNGALGGALSAKINHRLENTSARWFSVLIRTMSFALLISLLAGAVVGVAGGGIAAILFGGAFWTVFKLSLGAIMLGAIIGFPLVGIATILLRKLGINPDDVMGPIETTFFDVLTVVALVAVAGWLT